MPLSLYVSYHSVCHCLCIVFVFGIGFVFVIVKLLQRVGRAGDIAKLPVNVSLNACYVEEHVHPR